MPAARPSALRRYVLFCVTMASTLAAIITIPLQWNKTTYATGNRPATAFTMPLAIREKAGVMTVTGKFFSWLPYGRLALFTDECLDALRINDEQLRDPFPCDGRQTSHVNAGSALRIGHNVFTAIVRNREEGDVRLFIRPSPQDPLVLSIGIVLMISVLFTVAEWRRGGKRTIAWPSPEAWIVGGGILLRALYVMATPLWARGFDVGGHLEYIAYVAEHWTLPPLHAGWEYWQNPLYYFLSAIGWKIGTILGLTQQSLQGLLQLEAFVLSACTLLISSWMARMLFPKDDDTTSRVVFLMIVATVPGIVYFAARVNNDVLQLPLAALSLAFLLRWWTHPSQKKWLMLVAVMGLAILAKNTSLVLVPTALGALLLKQNVTPKNRLAWGAWCVAMLVLLAAFFLSRRFGSTDQLVAGNFHALHGGLKFQNALWQYISFSPTRIISTPIVDGWGDAGGRQYFWEFYWKTAFTAELFVRGRLWILAMWMLFSSLLLLPFAAFGTMVMKAKHSLHVPMLLCGAALIAGQAAFRWLAPASPSSDFRLTSLIVLPFAYCVVCGIRAFPQGMRGLGIAAMELCAILSTVYLLAL